MSESGLTSDTGTPAVWFDRHLAGAVPGYANGGVVAGTLASHLGGGSSHATEVRLQRPIPLERTLTVVRAGTTATLLDGTEVVATASPIDAELAHRGPVGADAARSPRPVVPVVRHPAPGCFVCGPTNRRGLNLQPGDVEHPGVVATLWYPPPDLADADGQLPAPVVWAALDCPSWYGGARGAPALLGTIIARHRRPVPATTAVVVSGWGVRRDGRKTMAGSAIHDANGELLAVASTIWIHPKEND